MAVKDINRDKLLKYLGDPDNDFLPRSRMSTEILGYADKSTMYQHFTPQELAEIEREALDIRRTKYAYWLSRVDIGQLKKAADGDPTAAKLVYQRFENWIPETKNTQENTGKDGGPIKHEWTNYPPRVTIEEWERQVRERDAKAEDGDED